MDSSDQMRTWDREYADKKVPTSFKTNPSKCTRYFSEFLAARGVALSGTILDVGCGNGRNGLYFAAQGVKACLLDISQNALAECEAAAKERGLFEKISLRHQSMAEPLPFPDSSFEFIISQTSLENLREEGELRAFAGEVNRTLKTSGFFLAYFLTPNDGYYQPYLDGRESGRSIAFSPETGMTVRLFTGQEVKRIFCFVA